LKINWDCTAETPGEKAPEKVVTGVSAPKKEEAPVEPEWTVDDLKAGKPMMVYYYVAVADASTAKQTEDNFKFSRKTEMSAFSNDAIERLNKNWVPKKVEIATDADTKLEKNQAHIEFWSFTGKKVDSITHKNQQALNPSDFEIRLKALEKKNREICDNEIKRLKAEEERKKKEETAAK
jgi:hypothetical protein